MRWHTSDQLHAHSADAVVESFYAALKSWRKRRKTDPEAKPPYRRRRYYRVQWKSSAICVRNGQLILSNGRGNPPLVVPWSWGTPTLVELGWTGSAYELRCVYKEKVKAEPLGQDVAAVDLGEIHLAVVHDGWRTIIFNGRALRTKRRYQNKTKAVLSSKQSRLKKGSRRWRKLQRSKRKQLQKLNRQIREILHKRRPPWSPPSMQAGCRRSSSAICGICGSRWTMALRPTNASTRWLRARFAGWSPTRQNGWECRLSSRTNPIRLRSVPAAGIDTSRTAVSISVQLVGSASTETASARSTSGRTYLGLGPVVGAMASPTGVRWHPHQHARVARQGEKESPPFSAGENVNEPKP